MWAVLVLLLLGVALLAFGGVVVALLFFSTTQSDPPAPAPITAPAPAPTRPGPPPMPPPTPVPSEPTSSVKVRFETVPTGAQVFEGETALCVTPCEIDHPEFAPATRQFVLKRAGFLDTPHVMADLGVQKVTLKPEAVRPTPKPRPDPGDILPTR